MKDQHKLLEKNEEKTYKPEDTKEVIPISTSNTDSDLSSPLIQQQDTQDDRVAIGCDKCCCMV